MGHFMRRRLRADHAFHYPFFLPPLELDEPPPLGFDSLDLASALAGVDSDFVELSEDELDESLGLSAEAAFWYESLR
jgi:hypothetical protein